MWRNITPGAGLGLQEVPEWTKEEEAMKEKRGHPPSHHTHENVLLNLSQGREGANVERGKAHEARTRGRVSGIPVHRLGEDARPLTAEEYRLYSPVITEMRGGGRVRNRGGASSSSMAQVLVRQRPGAASATGQSSAPLPGPPSQAAPPHLATLPATVPDQAEVLDLSSGPRRELGREAQPPPRPVPPPYVGSHPVTAHSSRSERPRHEDRALSLVGALRRLGTRVNLVPVNFASQRRSGSHSPQPREERRRGGWSTGSERERRRDESRSNRSRDRQAAVIERLSEYRRTRLPAAGRETEGAQSRGLAFVSRLSPDLGLAMPLAEATRLLTQGWEAGQVREADQFVRELEGEPGPAGHVEGYDPAQPTESREEEEGE